jgi:hypothetical protein
MLDSSPKITQVLPMAAKSSGYNENEKMVVQRYKASMEQAVADKIEEERHDMVEMFSFEGDNEAGINQDSAERREQGRSKHKALKVARTINIAVHQKEGVAKLEGYTNTFSKVVISKRPFPFQHHVKNPSCCLFNKKSKLRQYLFRIAINPDYQFPDNTLNIVTLQDMDVKSRKEL